MARGPGVPLTALRPAATTLFAVFTLLAALTCGCRKETAPAKQAEHKEVRAPRVVSLSPNLTEIACAVGAGELLVGRSDFCDYPASISDLPAVGGFTNPSIEKIVSLEPDLVLLTEAAQLFAGRLDELGIETLVLPNETIADVRRSIDEIGKALDRPRTAAQLNAEIDLALLKAARGASHTSKPKVLMIADRAAGTLSGAFAVGGGNFLDELIELSGGENVYGGSAVRYPIVSREYLIGVGPEVIVESAPSLTGDEAAISARIMDWRREMPMLPAVKAGRIHVITEEYLTIPGPRLTLALDKIHEAIAGTNPL